MCRLMFKSYGKQGEVSMLQLPDVLQLFDFNYLLGWFWFKLFGWVLNFWVRFVLFLPCKDGFRLDILYSDVDWIRSNTIDSITMREYYAYQLFQQFDIDAPMEKKIAVVLVMNMSLAWHKKLKMWRSWCMLNSFI